MTFAFPSALSRGLREKTPRWLAIAGYSARDFFIDGGAHLSAAIAFYAVLSLFPLALAGVSIAAWFIEPQWAIEQASRVLGGVTPHAQTIRDIIQKAIAARSHTDLVSLFVLLWAGTRVFAVLVRALNIACDVDNAYGFFRGLLVQLGMLLSVGLLFVGALVVDLVVPLLRYVLGTIPHGRAIGLSVIGWTLPAILLTGGFYCLYKFVPRHRCNWQSALLGALVATGLTLVARPIFLTYVGQMASYSDIYGWLAIGIILLVWAEIVAIITLYGGELASHIQMIAYDGLSGAEVTQKHRNRSPDRPASK